MNKICCVEDDSAILTALQYTLSQEGYEVMTAMTKTQGLELIQQESFDLVLLDVTLPDGSGYEICKRMREDSRLKEIPVIFLTACDDEVNIVMGLDLGADDYITKPFLPQELLLRLAAVLRRVYGAPAEEILCLGPVTIRWGSGLVERPDGTVSLTAKEYALLKKLWANRGNIVTIDALCAALWEGTLVGYENTLMVHIRRLREKIELDPSHPRYLLTVRGLGYRLLQEAAL